MRFAPRSSFRLSKSRSRKGFQKKRGAGDFAYQTGKERFPAAVRKTRWYGHRRFSGRPNEPKPRREEDRDRKRRRTDGSPSDNKTRWGARSEGLVNPLLRNEQFQRKQMGQLRSFVMPEPCDFPIKLRCPWLSSSCPRSPARGISLQLEG